LNKLVEQYCDSRDKELINESGRLDPSKNNKFVNNGDENPYDKLVSSLMVKPEEIDYVQLSNDEYDTGAKWSNIKLTSSLMIGGGMNQWANGNFPK